MDKSPAQTQTPEETLKAAIAAAATPDADTDNGFIETGVTAVKLVEVLTPGDKRSAELAKGRAMAERYAKAPPYIHQPEGEPEPLDLNQPIENLLAGVRSRDDIFRIYEAQKDDVPKPYVAPPQAPRLAKRIAAEMEKGAAAVARRVEELKTVRPAEPTLAELKATGSTSKVERPNDYVPNMNQGRTQPQGRR